MHHLGHETGIGQLQPTTSQTADAGPPTGSSDAEPDVDVATADQGNQEATNANADNNNIRGILSDCRWITAMITAGSYSKDVLSAVKNHLRAAKTLLQLDSVSSKRRLAVKKELAPDKKMETQLRVRSLQNKGRPRKIGLKKPNAVQIADMQNMLQTKGQQADCINTACETGVFVDNMLCVEVPYCVDAEDV